MRSLPEIIADALIILIELAATGCKYQEPRPLPGPSQEMGSHKCLSDPAIRPLLNLPLEGKPDGGTPPGSGNYTGHTSRRYRTGSTAGTSCHR